MAVASEAAALRAAALPLTGAPGDYEPLVDRVGDARFVLLGEATHGTHEMYVARAEITRRLITEKGFHAVAIEGDWPDAWRVHRYVTGRSSDGDAAEALEGFKRFPTWMWRNADVLDFVGWLRELDEARAPNRHVGFFGLDLYSLYASIEAVLAYLDAVDPDAAARARERYACFEQHGADAEGYAFAATLGLAKSCEDEATRQLVDMRLRAMRADAGDEEMFSAEQNARVVKNAEAYYRHMFGGRVSTWNLRDEHMADTLDAITSTLDRRFGRAKIVVWAHNSHVGDARATEMAAIGEHNIGQLVRRRHGRDAFLVGFSTYDGTVTAARDWGGPAERRNVRAALPSSWEALLHAVDLPALLLFPNDAEVASIFSGSRLERAIGVVYRPETERRSHYAHARVGGQFDALLHFDRTRAVEPLERTAAWDTGELPETYPFAL